MPSTPNIKELLTKHQVHFVEAGHNVALGNVNIKCPFCSDDPSEHLGIHLKSGVWGCWRNAQHRGKNLKRLLKKLGITLLDPTFDQSDIEAIANGTFFKSNKLKYVEGPRVTELPKEFVKINSSGSIDKRYHRYLQSRGFHDPAQVIADYDLHRCNDRQSPWDDRLIVPVWVGDEVCWTGRAIYENPMRYLSAKGGEARNIKHCLFNFNDLLLDSGEALVITEGPFDALKGDMYGKPRVRFTCIFGISTLSAEQARLIRYLSYKYDQVWLALDQSATANAVAMAAEIAFCCPQITEPPEKDFGMMSPAAIHKFCEGILDG